MPDFDVIFCGAGNGALACAAVLAKAGKRVALFEKNGYPGGVATSFRRGRFEFEVSLHELCGMGFDETRAGTTRAFFDYLGLSDKVNWVHIPEAYRMITFDEDNPIDVTMPFGVKNYIDAIEKYVPGSRESVEKFFSLAQEFLCSTADLGKATGKSDAIKRLLSHKDFMHACSMSANEGLEALDIPKRAADIIRGYWAYLCATCDDLTYLHYQSMVNSYIELGAVITQARSTELSYLIKEYIEQRQGSFFLNCPVEKINVQNGRAVSVSAGGKTYTATDIISNISPTTVFGSLVDGCVPESDIKKANARVLSGRGFCVFLGLNKSAEQLGLDSYSYFIYPDTDISRQFDEMQTPAGNRMQNTVCQNVACNKASPEGTCILTMTTLFPSDYWDKLSKEEYYKEKYAFAESMIANFEKATGVNIRDNIEEIEVATPVTFARFIGSPGGAIYGYMAKKWDGIFARKNMDKKFTQIEHLEFVGGFMNNLNGYSSTYGDGFNKAKYIITRDGGKV